MLGAIDAAPKPRKPAAQKVQKKKVGVLERPVELHNTEDQEKQETDRNMEEMWEVGTAACRVHDMPWRHAMPGAPAVAAEQEGSGIVACQGLPDCPGPAGH